MLTQAINFNAEFPIKEKTAYFNNASYTPMSRSAINAITSSLLGYSTNGPSDEFYLKLKEGANLARERLSKLIHSLPEDIVFTESATQSINLVANGLKIRQADVIITRGGSTEHPSNFLPWRYYARTKGIRILDLEGDEFGVPDLSELDSKLKLERSRLVVMSHVLYNIGTIMPAAEVSRIAHERSALFFLDASQSIGNVPVDLEAIDPDFMAGTAAKWLCGPLGLGFFYCKKEALGELEPLNYGPNSCTYKPDGTYQTHDTSWKLQEGFRNWAYCHGLSAAIDLIDRSDMTSLRKKTLRLADLIIEAIEEIPSLSFLGSKDKALRTNIVPVGVAEGAKTAEIVKRLAQDGVIISEREIKEKKILRISPHFYNDEVEADKLARNLKLAL